MTETSVMSAPDVPANHGYNLRTRPTKWSKRYNMTQAGQQATLKKFQATRKCNNDSDEFKRRNKETCAPEGA